jgi:HEAT repeat protein
MATRSSLLDQFLVRVAPTRYLARYKQNLAASNQLLLPGEGEARVLEEFYVPLRFLERAPSEAKTAAQKTKSIDIWDVLYRASRVAIIGEAGAGKTITLKYVAAMLAQEGKIPLTYVQRLTFLHHGKSLDELLPIYADLGQLDLHVDDLAISLAGVLAQYGFPSAANFLRVQLQEGRCLLLLDNSSALPTLARDGHLEELLAAYPKTLVAVAGRTPDQANILPDLVCFEPLPFPEADIETFVRRRLDSPAATSLLQALERSRALDDMAGNPFLLAALASASEDAPSSFLHLPDLYERCLQLLLGDETDPAAPSRATFVRETRQALQELALYFHEQRQEQFTEEELEAAAESVLEDLDDSIDKASFLAWIREAEVLRRCNGKQYAFLRVALQEFLTAQAVTRADRLDKVLRSYVDDPWWREVIVLATALLDNAEEVVPRLLATSTKPGKVLFLAARCAGEDPNLGEEVKEQLRPLLLELLEGSDESRWPLAAAYIAGLEKERIRDYFPRMLKEGSATQREEAALVLGRIGTQDWATIPLLGALERSEAWQVRRKAAWALGQLGDKRAALALLEAFKDEKEEVASEAALALSAIGESVVPSLTRSLSSRRPAVRQMAAEALGQMGPLAVEPLVEIVQNERRPDDVVRAAAGALGMLGDARAVPPLTNLLRARHGRIAQTAARALAAIGEPAVQPLIQALPTRSTQTALTAAIVQALVDIGKPAVEPLLRALDSSNIPVRNASEQALTRIGAPAIEELLRALRTGDWNLRRRIAHILTRLGDERAVGPLVEALSDQDPGVRARAAEILSQIGPKEAVVEPLLRAMQGDPERSVRHAMIKALAARRSERAVAPLIQALEDSQARDIAARALSEIGTASVEPLIRAIYANQDPEFQQACVKALQAIGARGRVEEQDQLAVARVYSTLLTERLTLDEMISLLNHIRWWKPGEELHRAFSTARTLFQARDLRDVAAYPAELTWVESIESPFRPAVQSILRDLNHVAQNIRLFRQDSRLAGQRGAMVSAIDTMVAIQATIDTQLLQFEKAPFGDIVAAWRTLTERALKDLRGRARLEIALLGEDLPLDSKAVAALVVFRLRNVGESPARNLSVTLKPGSKDAFEIIGEPTRRLDPLLTGTQQDVQFRIKPLGVKEAGYVFEVSYDDDEGTGRYYPTSGRVRFLVVGQEYRKIPISPYVLGPPVKTSKMFYGRRDVFDWITENISGVQQQNILVLHGERRMGKTSILYQLLNRPPSPQHICILFSLELATTTTPGDLFYDLAIDICEEMARHGLDVPTPEEGEFMRNAQRSFRRFFEQVEDVLGNRRLLIMFDEIDILIAKIEEGILSSDVFHFVRGLMQHSDKIAFLVTGAYKVNEMLKDNKSILFNIALPHKISYLNENEAAALIEEPVADYLNYDDPVVNKIIKVTACHPYFIQYICDSLVKLAQRVQKNWVFLPDVDVVLQEVIQDNTGQLEKAIYAQLTKPEQQALTGLANVTDDRTVFVSPDAVAEVLARYELDIPKPQLLDALRSLRERDLVVEQRIGQSLQYGFKMGLIRMWLRRSESLLRLGQAART